MKYTLQLFSTLLLIASLSCTDSKKHQEIDASEFDSLSKRQEVIVLDVRTKEEITEGFIPGTDLFIDIKSPQFEEEIAKLDSSKTYLVYCRSGSRSGKACEILSKKGFKKVYSLKGGISEWPGETTKN